MNLLNESGIVSEEIFSIVANTNDLMFVKNLEFKYIAASGAYVRDCVGCNNIEDVIGRTDFELFTDREAAEYYRAGDETLLASDKDMLEFEEEYTDREGKKHTCMTAKYLLRGADGEPTAILGQYHDMDNQLMVELKNSRDESHKASLALCRPFFVSNYVNLKTHSYTNLWAMDYVKDIIRNSNTADEGFAAFIEMLVKPEFHDTVSEFCNLDTLAQRLKGKNQIDCEYLSKIAVDWCRISFYPAEWDDEGEVTHVLFTVKAVDDNQARVIEAGRSGQKTLKTIFDEVPGGIVLYQWDGQSTKVLKSSRYYRELYGLDAADDMGTPNFDAVHPDDIVDYNNAIHRALTETHSLEHVFRVWNLKRNRYGWMKINAIVKPQSDGMSYVYAMFTDVTEQKIAELRLKKSNASIAAALGASAQYIYEYDPIEHTSTSFSAQDNGYNLEPVIENYPECFLEGDYMHPDDVETFVETVHKIDNGEPSAHCTIRANLDGNYHWHSCTFDAFYDQEKDRRIALLTVVDVTPQVMAVKGYENRLHMLARTNRDALCMCEINLTKNTFFNTQASGSIREYSERAKTLDELMLFASEKVFDLDEREKYKALFCRDAMLEMFEKGENLIRMEHLYRVSTTHTEWVETIFNLELEPTTGDVVGICCARSINKRRMDRILLNAALDQDYPMAAMVYADTGEYYLYETGKGIYCERRQDFWGVIHSRLAYSVAEEDLEGVRNNLNRDKVMRHLETHSEFSCTFYGLYFGKRYRLEAKLQYVDREHKLLRASLRNITDDELYQQYKYDSEHDQLTGLLNRRTLFSECRRLLNEYPDKQFVMVHCDVRHFHLYNTFFGEDEGDKLLCRISELINGFEKDYSCYACGRIESDVFCALFPADDAVFEAQVHQSFFEMEELRPDFPLELAIGAYWITDQTMSIEAMFSRATIAAKSGEKNLFGMISAYDEGMEQNLKDNQQIISEMTQAVEQEQFEVWLQPKVELATEKVVGAEALARWIHPEHGVISPGKFIPVFEQNGFIAELDRYMWEHTCSILRRWKDEGRRAIPVSINISRVSMYSRATVPFLKSLVEKYSLDPGLMELELTETAYMDDPEDLKHMLKDLQEYGFNILMDDFGSGYSSLNTLRELPVNMLKLDMKFLTDSQNDSRANAVLSSVVRMSKLLNLPITAEGVEERGQAEYLRGIGCEYAQGYLFARPMPVEEFEQLLADAEAAESGVDYDGNLTGDESRLEGDDISCDGEDNQYEIHAAEMVRAIDNTGIRTFMYYPQTRSITIPRKTCEAYQCASVYTNMPHSFAEDYVHPDDYHVFKEMYYRINRGEQSADAIFHSKDNKYCNHVTLTTVSWTDDGRPKDVFGLIENRTEVFNNEQFIAILQKEITSTEVNAEMNTVLKNIAVAIGGQYYAVYHIWIESRTYVCLQEKLPDILSLIGERGDYQTAWDQYIEGYLDEADQDDMRRFVEISTLGERIGDKDSISHIYRRKEVGWTRGQFIPAERDADGRLLTVIYTVSDINEEIENDKRRYEAEQEAMRDPMTGLLNRKAFNHFTKQEKYTAYPTGLMLFDIDHFKGVNDQHGHEIGDMVIRAVCDEIKNSLRRDDLVFRMGGDELAVLMYDCREDIWNSVCRKISQTHADMKEALPEEMNVTLSAGLCLNSDGYCEEMYKLADRALYHTKSTGRGGCTMVDMQGLVLKEWHDTSAYLHKGETLETLSLVMEKM